MYDEQGKLIWETELDIYGKVRTFAGRSLSECPFRYQGQYEDVETGLYYNRFRYYDPSTGNYISQDPIRLAGNNPTLYGYVFDNNSESDPFGLKPKKQQYDTIVRYGSKTEADASKSAGGLVLRPGHESQPKWVVGEGEVKPKTLGKPKNYTHKMTFECEPGTIEWMKQQGFEIKPTNEPGRYAIPADQLDTFNKRVKNVKISCA